MEKLNNIVQILNGYLSNYVLIIALLGGGIWFSFQLRFIQLKGFGEGMRRTFGGLFSKKGEAGHDGMSSFQALATAIAAQVGTGNIAGAATAIAVGGPGAIFWMWVAAFLGMATIFAEAVVAQKFKHVAEDGSVTGGPVYYIRAAFKGNFGRTLAGIFAVLIIFALGFMGNSTIYYGHYHCDCCLIYLCRWYPKNRQSDRKYRAFYGCILHHRFTHCYFCQC